MSSMADTPPVREGGQGAVAMPPKRCGSDRGALKPKTDPDFDLKLQLGAVHRATNVFDLEPVDVAQRLLGFGERVADSLMDAVLRDPDDVNNFIRLIHRGSSSHSAWCGFSLAPRVGRLQGMNYAVASVGGTSDSALSTARRSSRKASSWTRPMIRARRKRAAICVALSSGWVIFSARETSSSAGWAPEPICARLSTM